MIDPQLPKTGRLAGIDFGTVRIGIALSDPEQTIASPYATYQRRTESLDRDYFVQLARREQIVGFVVGLPIYASGDESEMSRRSRDFAGWLTEATGCPCQLLDERMTSAEAERLLRGVGMTSRRRRARIDSLAAQILLAAYLESPGGGPAAGALED